jgi:hypothetical protein
MNNQGNTKNGIRVQTNLNNLTSDFDLCSPLNSKHNKHIQNFEGNGNTIESFQNQPINQGNAALNVMDCSTLSTHSINDVAPNGTSGGRGVSKANLQISEPGLNDGRKG